MHVVASGRLEHVLLHEVLVLHSALLLDNHRENHVAQIAVTFTLARSITQMALQENLEQGLMVWRSSEMVLHHDVAGRGYRVAGIVVETCLMAQQLFYGDVVVSLVLDTVVVGGIVQDSLRSEYLLVHLELLHLLQFHDANGGDELGNGSEAHQHVRFHSDAPFLVCPSETAGIEQGVVAGDDELCTVDFPSLEVSLHERIHLVVFLTLGEGIADGIVDMRLGERILCLLLIRR